METIEIQTESANLTEEQFFQLCVQNKGLRFERDKHKTIFIMSPTGLITSSSNTDITRQLANWNHKYKLGKAFDSNGGFTLPNGAMRAADAAWITQAKWDKIPFYDKKKFAHICPDFVIELLSERDSLKVLQEKMEEWIENGCRLAWLIDSKHKKVHIYKSNREIKIQGFDKELNGEDVLPGFVLDLKEILCT